MRAKIFLSSVLVCAIIALVAGCGGVNIYAPKDDVMLGRQVATEIESNPKKYPILKNLAATEYVQSIVDSIINSPKIQYKNIFSFKVRIIDRDDVVNAFCAPGGFIYVYTGLIDMLDYEATFAAVMAHEIAHAELRHATQRMTKAFGAQLASDILLGDNAGAEAKIAANLFTGLALLQNSRFDEYEADRASFAYMQSTGWYCGGIKLFFDKIKASGDGSTLKMLLSTHPLPPERIDEVNKLLKKNDVPPPMEENLRRRRFSKFKEMFE
jgi:predicted Zn-dependent protease